jgi:cytochrome c oxidase subunit 4
MATEEGQQHPLKIYFLIWGLLFLFSAFSYATDFLPKEGGMLYFRALLILALMLLKAGFIIAIFMHMTWERSALIWAIIGPPVLLLFLIGFMVFEGDYTETTRVDAFVAPPEPEGLEHH